ncbi:thioesterase family protein [Mangrovihabitans endophyticus]|uniref:Thioesterase n=1 Tax=Mangrovihabitans endophyticus TaxID=1751298 RepID=A0A8J3C7G6_9ACTN|nr:thioesterase family protein [Mangrovihabitans endophyticus]GGL15114.1 thioesterase [Mangrovihabitans endophyticus]
MSYFTRVGAHRYRPSEFTGGAWAVDEQHISPLCGLVVHAIDRFAAERDGDGGRGGVPMVIGRLTFDILGVIRLEDFDIHVEVVRPGRTVELVEAVVTWADRTVVRARAWRLARHDTAEVAGGAAGALPAPQTLTPWDMTDVWPGEYIRSIEVRPAGEPGPGRTTAWITSEHDLVAGEPSTPLARFVRLVDTANGIAVRQNPKEWMFPNLDLSIHLHRQPHGDWVGLDTTVVFGADGQGLTSTTLHDVTGPVGRAEQILTVRPQR